MLNLRKCEQAWKKSRSTFRCHRIGDAHTLQQNRIFSARLSGCIACSPERRSAGMSGDERRRAEFDLDMGFE